MNDASATSESSALLEPEDMARLRATLRRVIEVGADIEPGLAGAVRQVLDAPGSLWRAQLAWAIGTATGLSRETASRLAAAVESFHNASLLFDDLPAMDDAETRRGRQAVHRVHGEAAAILAGLAFVHRGYGLVLEGLEDLPTADRRAVRRQLEADLGLAGILDGQARDLSPGVADDPASLAAGKTVPLLRLALLLPALVAGAPADLRARLLGLAEAWGLAYQILDDLGDLVARTDGVGTDAECGRLNLAGRVGASAAVARLDLELARAAVAAAEIVRQHPGLEGPLLRLQRRFVAQRHRFALAEAA
jgi:geranylgeranyl pyrophosphate synthase